MNHSILIVDEADKRRTHLRAMLEEREEAVVTDHDLQFLVQLTHHAAIALEKAGIIHQLKKKGNRS
jgi:hypothetical protein